MPARKTRPAKDKPARKRRGFRFVTAVLSLGLSFALGLALYLAAQRPDKTTATSQAHFGEWLGRAFDQIGLEIELMLGAVHKEIAGTPQPSNPQGNPSLDPVAALGIDPTGLREALALYKASAIRQGDDAAAMANDPLVQTTLAWVALRALPHDAGFDRMQDFLDAHPSWPSRTNIEHQMEQMLYDNTMSAESIEQFFSGAAPETDFGRLALARAFKSEGDEADAQRVIRAVWRTADLPPPIEAKVKSEFASDLSKDDDKARADALLYKYTTDKYDSDASLRAANAVGAPYVALAKLRIAAHDDTASDKMFTKLPKPMQSDPGYSFAKAEKLVYAEKFKDAATLILSVPHDPAHLVDGDAWWTLQRGVARKLLDQGESQLAYRLCAEHTAVTNSMQIEEEFQAGWIALRFLNDAHSAAQNFRTVALLAEMPISIARAAYWRGRTADVLKEPEAAKAFYETAAAQSETYYGQLAREHLGLKTVPIRDVEPAATGAVRDESIRAVELLYAAGEKDMAYALAYAAAQHMTSQSQLAALAKIVAAQRDAHASLTIGKILAQRRIPMDSLAFPTYGVPNFDPVENSASPALVYAIARQESAFDPKAVSSAGARGLMQMIDSTAKRTADKEGLTFQPDKMMNDTAFNAKLGAAHLGELLQEEKGSPILVFAAYNAGGHRVSQWIEAYGDPRLPNVDPVDWVERIPFNETRNYVQRVMENLTMYQASFGEAPGGEMLREIHAKL